VKRLLLGAREQTEGSVSLAIPVPMSLVHLVVLAMLVSAYCAGSIPRKAQAMTREALVIFDGAQDNTALARVTQLVDVTQRLPPRLAIVRGEGNQLEALRKLPGILAVCEDAVADSILQQLNSAERIFAEAWVAGRQPKATRPGEGLPWDAPGFQPPDRPGTKGGRGGM
jgi:hypothetical protein